jgi:hypothetical protein
MILFEFIKSGLGQRKRCIYVSEEGIEAVKREMSDAGINVDQFTKKRSVVDSSNSKFSSTTNFSNNVGKTCTDNCTSMDKRR